MTDSVSFFPSNCRGVTAYLVVKGAVQAIEYYKKVFAAEETLRLAAPDGSIGHAELIIAGGPVMLADEVPDMDIRSPQTIGDSGTGLLVYVEDPDSVFQLAIDNGASQFKPVADQFYGNGLVRLMILLVTAGRFQREQKTSRTKKFENDSRNCTATTEFRSLRTD